MSNNNIHLILSGSIFSGYTCSIPRSTIASLGEHDITQSLKANLMDLLQKYNLFDLLSIARTLQLHIHVEWNVTSDVIYVCTCDH